MAAAGGGKIRNRRYHLASKPYAKSSQPGLISRVTDTVKSIVPNWLQRYFRNGEATEAEGSVSRHHSQTPPCSNNGSGDGPLADGRATPEPSTSHAEPSTSKSALNFQDILARPPLSRSHLYFPSLDSSPALGVSRTFTQPSTSSAPFSGSPFTQPSTSSAPFSGSPFTQPSTSAAAFLGSASSFSLVKEAKDTGSQHEDDNISTTSGFSSRASDKDVTTSKPTSLPLLWSPENERNPSSSNQAQSSTIKKPAFNLSLFGTSSNSLNNSTLNASQLGDSPFYPGKTTYGGAAAARSNARLRPGTPYQAPVRRQIKAKPAGAQPCGVTSATARRILLSLERMSSPLADAKRIPSTVSSPLSPSLERSDVDFQSKRKKVDSPLPPVQKLVVPAALPTKGSRSMSFRPSLTPSGSRVSDRRGGRERIAAKQTAASTDALADAPPSTSSFAYPLSSTPAPSGSAGAGGKMKRERSTRAPTKRLEDEISEVPNLPVISLPIGTSTLPTFSFTSQPSASISTTTTPSKPQSDKGPPAASSPPCASFTFSFPIVKATVATAPSLPSSPANFTFSEPVAKSAPSEVNGKTNSPLVLQVRASPAPVEDSKEFEGLFKPARELKQGSVLDILRGPGFSSSPTARSSPGPGGSPDLICQSESSSRPLSSSLKPAVGMWDCSTCLVQNVASESRCVACQANRPATDSSLSPKPHSQPVQKDSIGLGTLFVPIPGSWECDTCLVRNKAEVVKCVACDTAKPGTGVKPGLTLPTYTEAITPSSNTTTTMTTATTNSSSLNSTFAGFDKFKKPEGVWECDTCMVENKAQDSTCVACQSPKPGSAPAPPPSSTNITPAPPGNTLLGFGDKFKKPEGSWDCPVCCLQNQAAAGQCVACQANKPGSSELPKGFASTTASTSSFTFGIQSSSSVSGTSTTTSLGGFKFGSSSSDSASSLSTGAFKFSSPSGGFKFGTSSSSESKEEGNKGESQAGAGFKFGVSGSTVPNSSKAPNESSSISLSKPEKSSVAPIFTGTGFSFSTPKPKPESEAEPVAVPTSIPVFSFGKPKEAEPVKFGDLTEKSEGVASLGSAPTTAPTATFTFGKPEEKRETSTPPATFLFGKPSEAEKPTPSVGFFSKAEPPKPTFSFGKKVEKSDATELPKPSFTFGSTAVDPAASKPAFGLLPNSTTSSSSITSSTPAPSLFASGVAAAPPSSNFVFGQMGSSDATPTKAFVFGQQPEGQPQNPTPAPTQPFMFGSGASTPAPSFSFGTVGASASGTAPTTSASGASSSPFMFSAAASSSSSSSVAPSGPTFAPTFGQGGAQSSHPTFGPASLFSAPAAQPPSFGAPSGATQTPMFGQQAAASPAFGAAISSSAPGGGFQFGGNSGFGAPAGNTGVFSFGSGAGGSSATPTPPANFSFNQPPAFNIGSSKNTFTPAAQHSISGRKIKTAVRRRK